MEGKGMEGLEGKGWKGRGRREALKAAAQFKKLQHGHSSKHIEKRIRP